MENTVATGERFEVRRYENATWSDERDTWVLPESYSVLGSFTAEHVPAARVAAKRELAALGVEVRGYAEASVTAVVTCHVGGLTLTGRPGALVLVVRA